MGGNVEFEVFNQVAYKKDEAARLFYKQIEEKFKDRDQCICYYMWPEYPNDINLKPTFTIVDREYGVIVFKIYPYQNGTLKNIYENYWEDSEGTKFSNELDYFNDYCFRFKGDIETPSHRIRSKIPFKSYVCFPYLNKNDIYLGVPDDNLLFDDYMGSNIFETLDKAEISNEDWEKLQSIVQKANFLKKSPGIPIEKPLKNLREAIDYNNNQIYRFDTSQMRASLNVTNYPERIRGLAGTGKTVILAVKAAVLHSEYPDAKIVYTFQTHSLHNQIKNLISNFYRKLKGDEPNWDNLKVMHAWGGRTSGPGIYYNACISNNIQPRTLRDVRSSNNPFGHVCNLLLNEDLKPEYNYVLIDEAQDLPNEFFKLLERLTIESKLTDSERCFKKIIWAYDDLQTTNQTKMPDSEELFGKNSDGTPKIPLYPHYDYILKKSYRNHQDVLLTAFALGFGFYCKDGMVQIISDEPTWKALGFDITKNENLISNIYTEIIRPPENSPNKIDELFEKYEVINLTTFENTDSELDDVASKIENLIKNENVRPHEIMVIDLATKPDNLIDLQLKLYDKEIVSKIPGVVDDPKEFFIDSNVTLTNARRAKGNEVPVVFVIGCNAIYNYGTSYDHRILRNMIFSAITRSKGWCFLSASGNNSEIFKEEYSMIKQNIPSFKFDFPSADKLKEIERIDLLIGETEFSKKLKDLAGTLNKIASMENPEDLKPLLNNETVANLEKLINRG